jgi:hypothetical protein
VVYSRADAVVRLVDRVWIDNAFDTIRSRGVKATNRLARPINPSVPSGPRNGELETIVQ